MLGWGLFIALLVGLLAPRMGVRPVATIAVAATAVVAFGLLWALSGRDADARRGAAGSPRDDEADTKESAPAP
ncbi:hypothetical protein GCM10023081_41340 [Arthrobacter ginkgonis]|uniref:Uncharacterized protein n=2 Tax=Arthrobacter ginkgonis TaxID=1630594 RepID=A0ABP7D7M8_9MICC